MSILLQELRQKIGGFYKWGNSHFINIIKIKFFLLEIRTHEHKYTMVPFIKCLIWFLRLELEQ